MNHTPGPWHLNTYSVTNDDGIDRGFEIWGSNHSVAIIPLKPENHSHAKANGEHIVHCVNTHDALVEALRFVMKATADWPGTMSASIDAIREQTQEALALAEGKEPRS